MRRPACSQRHRRRRRRADGRAGRRASTNGTLTLNADGSFTYTPAANFNGTDSFTYKANDGTADSNVATVTITVNPVNDAPVAVDDVATRPTRTRAGRGRRAGQRQRRRRRHAHLTRSVAEPANGTLALNADGAFTYTPDAELQRHRQLHLQGQRRRRPTANVATVDDHRQRGQRRAGARGRQPCTTDEDTPPSDGRRHALGVADVDDGTATRGHARWHGGHARLDARPITRSTQRHRPRRSTPNGVASRYTPAANFNGTDTFTYTAIGTTGRRTHDDSDRDDHRQRRQRRAGGGRRRLHDRRGHAAERGGAGRAGQRHATSSSDALTAVLVGGPSNGTLTLNADGTFSYTPAANFNGTRHVHLPGQRRRRPTRTSRPSRSPSRGQRRAGGGQRHLHDRRGHAADGGGAGRARQRHATSTATR